MRRAILGALLASLVTAAPAGAWLALAADTSRQPGWIGFYVAGTSAFTRVNVAERVGAVNVPLVSVVPPAILRPEGVFSVGYYPDVVQWRCDRLTRSFTATGYTLTGPSVTAAFDVVTPSCRNRLALIAPARVRPGATVRVRVRDGFELGHTSAIVCVRAPGRAAQCRVMGIGGTEASLRFVARRGHSVVSLTSPYGQHLRTVVSAGVPPPANTAPLPVVLATGDSLMESVDAQLSDLLSGRADVAADVQPGSGFSSSPVVSWAALPAQQMRRFHARAVVLFIGANEGYPMTTPTGAVVTCCGAPYVSEYARRIRAATETYLHDGSKAVIWLDVPFMQDPQRNPSVAAVDSALPQAVAGVHDATVLDMAGLFTPGDVYREFMTVDGRTVRVRESDGVHLSPGGAAIAADAVIQELDRLHVI